MNDSFFKTAMRLSFRGKWMVRVLTILLSAMSFMFFAIASTAFTFDVFEFQASGYQNYMMDKEYFLFMNDIANTSLSPSSLELLLTNQEISAIENGVDLNFVTSCRNQIDVGYFLDKSYFRGEKYVYDQNGEIEEYTDEYKAYLKEVEGRPLDFSVPKISVGTEASYEELNYRLLAGRYPEAVNEIAVSKEIYEDFAWGGMSMRSQRAAIRCRSLPLSLKHTRRMRGTTA